MKYAQSMSKLQSVHFLKKLVNKYKVHFLENELQFGHIIEKYSLATALSLLGGLSTDDDVLG